MTSSLHHLSHSPQNVPPIRLSSINPFLLELARRNAQPQALLRSLNLPDDVPASGELFVSPGTIYELVERSAEHANDPYLGFRIGQNLELRDWEPISKAISKATAASTWVARPQDWSRRVSSRPRPDRRDSCDTTYCWAR